jgi:natural product precursor
MKTRRFNKKLTLNKKTIVNLDRSEMKDLYGGDILSTHIATCSRCVTVCGSDPCC